ncbi:MAG: HNH endonuclease [Planctomycetaceae bacterium]|nr:HNH endonuclease [Planctomycetaceae bacterium]
MNGTRTCSVDECPRGIYARKLCKVHYRTAKLRGDFTPDPRYGAAEALAARVNKVGDCLIWTGSTKSDGYGQIKIAGKARAVHQVAWEFANGPIPEGLEIDHTCFNPGCVNTDHLRLATRAQNNRNLSGARSNSRTGVRNVSPVAGGFQVQIRKAGRFYHFGTFATIDAAQRVAEAARAEMFGDFAGRAALGGGE